MRKKLIIATTNLGKLAEFQAILSPIQCIAQHELSIPSVAETGLSFIENALIKARNASASAQQPALADDSGLVVPFLNGEPGIYSARYSQEHASELSNIHFLLQKLAHTEASARNAFFYCAIALTQYADDPTPLIATGVLQGKIIMSPQGENGFGYDPVFYVPVFKCTLAEMSAEQKNSISHRAKALNSLKEQLKGFHFADYK